MVAGGRRRCAVAAALDLGLYHHVKFDVHSVIAVDKENASISYLMI